MVKHIVLFKLKDEAPADEKLAAMNSFKAAIEALPAKISVIRKGRAGKTAVRCRSGYHSQCHGTC